MLDLLLTRQCQTVTYKCKRISKIITEFCVFTYTIL